MCPITYDKEAKAADKPIPCYKVVWKMPDSFRSEYRDFRYDIGGEHSMEPGAHFHLRNVAHPTQLSIFCGFHSYARPKNAADRCRECKEIKGLSAEDFYGQVILRCEIPAGAGYWNGNIFSPGYKEYCSDRIKVTGRRFRGEREWRT